MNRKFKSLLIVLLLTIAVLGFQNCSPGFKTLSNSTFSSLEDGSADSAIPMPSDSDPAPPVSLPLPGPLSPGQIFNISTLMDNHAAELAASLDPCPAGTGVETGCSAMTDYGSMLYDESQERFIMYGGGHGPGRSSSLLTIDLETQKWQAAYVGTPYSLMYQGSSESSQHPTNTDPRCFYKDTGAPIVRHTYDMMEIVPDFMGRPTLFMLTGGGVDFKTPVASGCTIGQYDITARQWTWTDKVTDKYYYYASSSAYDPISKKFLIVGNGPQVSPSLLYTYDPETTEVTMQKYTGEFGIDNNMVYFPLNDRFYLISRGNPGYVTEVIPNRQDFSQTSFTRLALSGEAYSEGSISSGWKYDAENQVIGGGIKNGRFYYFDPIAKTWGSVAIQIQVGGSRITATAFHNIAYDHNKKVWVFIDDVTKKTWVFRFKK